MLILENLNCPSTQYACISQNISGGVEQVDSREELGREHKRIKFPILADMVPNTWFPLLRSSFLVSTFYGDIKKLPSRMTYIWRMRSF